jgi:site-specific recombinase XerD
MRIEEALERFTTQLAANGRSVHSRKQFARHVGLLARWARSVRPCGDALEALDHEAVAGFLASAAATQRTGGGQKLATSTNCLRSSVKTFLGYCHRAGYIAQDPGRLIRRAICAAPLPRALSDDEQHRLLGALSTATGCEAERDHALFHLLLASGVRLGSALALDVDDVDLEGGEVQLRVAKGDRRERVFLGAAIMAHLERYLAGRKTCPVFAARDGRRITQRHAQRRFAGWIEAAGIARKVSPHALRHSFGMRIYSKTHDLILTKQALRHRSVSSTLVYARASEERLRQAL